MEKRWKTNREKPELLIPAKDLEVLRTAVNFGADAVYIGGEAFSLRAKARNFSPEDMRAGIAYAHEHGVHVHVAANIFAHNRDLDQAAAYFTELAQMKPDAVLVADPGMFMIAKRHLKNALRLSKPEFTALFICPSERPASFSSRHIAITAYTRATSIVG